MNIQEWHGSNGELLRLQEAVQRHCSCSKPPSPPQPTCPSHAMLTNQLVLDHLLYVYRARDGFVAQEFAISD